MHLKCWLIDCLIKYVGEGQWPKDKPCGTAGVNISHPECTPYLLYRHQIVVLHYNASDSPCVVGTHPLNRRQVCKTFFYSHKVSKYTHICDLLYKLNHPCELLIFPCNFRTYCLSCQVSVLKLGINVWLQNQLEKQQLKNHLGAIQQMHVRG